ncbi:hypothetical protein [Pseudoalteromonas sp. P1-25]|uniref:hypothetical protein n=1 Tax=Pseudoalteromonas sp. P1-25 TaxID=1723758 RepID=UPI0006D6719C|nr:hypothetical protein [Pseudoalteromonas sp. P1-25]KPZ56227.1 hypothetical protein AN393_01267 [Pseudoalteromonas sp. P1-25]
MNTIIKASIVLTGLCFAHSASADNCLQGCPTGLDNGNTIERSVYIINKLRKATILETLEKLHFKYRNRID